MATPKTETALPLETAAGTSRAPTESPTVASPIMASPTAPKKETALPLETAPGTGRAPTESPTVASPIVVSPTTMISPNNQGWKITIKNADGSSNEVMIEPKALAEEPGNVANGEENVPAPVNTRLRIYLGIQYMLNAILAIAIIALMILTIVKYNSTKNVVGAWPASPVLSPTILMIVVSCINVIVDSANLLVQCCGAKIIRKMAYIATKAHTITSAITALLPAVAAGYSAIAQTTSNGADLWSFSCSPPAAQMVAVNSSDTICAANQAAWVFQLAQIIFQILSVIVPLYARMRPTDKPKPDAQKPAGGKGKGDADNEEQKDKTGDEEALLLINDSSAFATPATKT